MQNFSRCRTLRSPEGYGSLPFSGGVATAQRKSTGAIPCAAFRIVAAWMSRRTVRTLRLAAAASRQSRSQGTRSLCPGRSGGTGRSRARELAFVAVRPADDTSIRRQQASPTRSRTVRTRFLCPGRLCGTRRTTCAITRHTCRVNFALTHSKQTIGALANRNRFRGSAGARLEAKN